jgi:hypothetical protein
VLGPRNPSTSTWRALCLEKPDPTLYGDGNDLNSGHLRLDLLDLGHEHVGFHHLNVCHGILPSLIPFDGGEREGRESILLVSVWLVTDIKSLPPTLDRVEHPEFEILNIRSDGDPPIRVDA